MTKQENKILHKCLNMIVELKVNGYKYFSIQHFKNSFHMSDKEIEEIFDFMKKYKI